MYNKFKEETPEKTVFNIKNILKNLNITTTESWTDSGVNGCFSVKITVNNTTMSQNGKGTSVEYALASGYAELMERIQTGFFYPFSYDNHLYQKYGFYYAPDEIIKTPEETCELGGDLLTATLEEIRKSDGVFKILPVNEEKELRKWCFAFPGENECDKIVSLPYKDILNNEKCFLPYPILFNYYYTNGSCAGNTKDEALVQGLSEIFERYSANIILKEKLTPPIIPEEVLAKTSSLYDTINKIRENKRFSLRIMDASLGKGLPVVATALIDKTSGKYLLRFGAHPDFIIALERTITEIFQNRNINSIMLQEFSVNSEENSQSISNRFNFCKTADGIYPNALFSNKASWKYRPFIEVSPNLSEQLNFLISLVKKLGYKVYVRDCSYLGFPTFHIVVPGMSFIFDFGSIRIREKILHNRITNRIRKLKDVNIEELNEIEEFIDLKKDWLVENTFKFIAKVPLEPEVFGKQLDATIIKAFILIKKGKLNEAKNYLLEKKYTMTDGLLSVSPFWVLIQVIDGKILKYDFEYLFNILKNFYPEEWIKWAFSIIDDPFFSIPYVDCYNCDKCNYKLRCGYPDIKILNARLKREMLTYF